jgi:hypothetical protein
LTKLSRKAKVLSKPGSHASQGTNIRKWDNFEEWQMVVDILLPYRKIKVKTAYRVLCSADLLNVTDLKWVQLLRELGSKLLDLVVEGEPSLEESSEI